jgi:hypothetical protein
MKTIRYCLATLGLRSVFFWNILVALYYFFPSASYATAVYDVNSIVLASSGIFDLRQNITVPAPENHSVSGGSYGYALETHIKDDEEDPMVRGYPEGYMKCIGSISNCTIASYTKITAHGEAMKPYGYAWTTALAQVGYEFTIDQAMTVTITLLEDVHIHVSTQEDGETAFAHFTYSVLFDNAVLKDSNNQFNPVDVTLKSVDGTCVTDTCEFNRNNILTTYTIPVNPGTHSFVIDPEFSTPDFAKVPEPYSLSLMSIGLAGMAFSNRKKRGAKPGTRNPGQITVNSQPRMIA